MSDFNAEAELKRIRDLGTPEKQWDALEQIRDKVDRTNMVEVIGGMKQDEVDKIARVADAKADKTLTGKVGNFLGKAVDGIDAEAVKVLSFGYTDANHLAARAEAPLDADRRARLTAGYEKITTAYKDDTVHGVSKDVGVVAGFVAGGEVIGAVKWGSVGIGSLRLGNIGNIGFGSYRLGKVATMLGYGEEAGATAAGAEKAAQPLWKRALTSDFWKRRAQGLGRFATQEAAMLGISAVVPQVAEAAPDSPSVEDSKPAAPTVNTVSQAKAKPASVASTPAASDSASQDNGSRTDTTTPQASDDDGFFGGLMKMAKNNPLMGSLINFMVGVVVGLATDVPSIGNLINKFSPGLIDKMKSYQAIMNAPTVDEATAGPAGGAAPEATSKPQQKPAGATAQQKSDHAAAPTKAAQTPPADPNVPARASGQTMLGALKAEGSMAVNVDVAGGLMHINQVNFDGKLTPDQQAVLNGQSADKAKLVEQIIRDKSTSKPLSPEEQKLLANKPVMDALKAGATADVTTFGTTHRVPVGNIPSLTG